VRWLAVATVVLLACALALPLWQKSRALARLESELGALRKDVTATQAARAELDLLLAEENALLKRRAQRPTQMRTLHELTQLLPDTTWVSHLDVDGTRVRIRGESPDASALLASIERSALFTGASFEGSVTRDPGSTRERFAIAAAIREKP
jgi:general secretion pathway protein L